MKVTTNKIVLERDNTGRITVRTYASHQADIKYVSKDGLERIATIWNEEKEVYPMLSDFKEKEFFNRIADVIDSKVDEKPSK